MNGQKFPSFPPPPTHVLAVPTTIVSKIILSGIIITLFVPLAKEDASHGQTISL